MRSVLGSSHIYTFVEYKKQIKSLHLFTAKPGYLDHLAYKKPADQDPILLESLTMP